jgi:hypothetical protein
MYFKNAEKGLILFLSGKVCKALHRVLYWQGCNILLDNFP